MHRDVLTFTHISTYNYKLVHPTLCEKAPTHALHTHICGYALLIDEGSELHYFPSEVPAAVPDDFSPLYKDFYGYNVTVYYLDKLTIVSCSH